MRTKISLLLCFCVLVMCTASTSAIGSTSEASDETTKDGVTIKTAKDSYTFEDKKIPYVINNRSGHDVEISSSRGSLQKKNGDEWVTMPSTWEDPMAWCGVQGSVIKREMKSTISFSDYNGTLFTGTYRISFSCQSQEGSEYFTASSNEFTLTGDFPVPNGRTDQATFYLAFDNNEVPKSAPQITYKIVNTVSAELYISPDIMLALYQNSEWHIIHYETGQNGELVSHDKENVRTIHADKLPNGFENCSKLRVIERVATPSTHANRVFYLIQEIKLN